MNTWSELQRRNRPLAWFALLLLLAMLPTLLALALDTRELRGVSVWAKPLKFMASISLFAATTAWFMGLLQDPRRRGTGLVAWAIIVAGGAEVVYITWQAALGQASHYNVSDRFHAIAYPIMGAGALAMMLTQPLLAWLIARHGRADTTPAWRHTVVLALCMTFVLGVAAAGPLSAAQPPSGPGLPVLGWHLGGGDLRPAHFIGSHAQQFVPFVGWLLLWLVPARVTTGVALFAVAYTGLWAAALLLGLHGAAWMQPPR